MPLDERVEAIHAEIFTYQIKNIKPIIRRALVEQDKITRHACAEKVSELGEYCYECGGDTLFASEGHAAVMNCRGGVE